MAWTSQAQPHYIGQPVVVMQVRGPLLFLRFKMYAYVRVVHAQIDFTCCAIPIVEIKYWVTIV